MPPVPDNLTPGEASDICVLDGFAYVGRFDNDTGAPLPRTGRRVEVFDARIPTASVFHCVIPTTPGMVVEDLLIEADRYLYIAQRDDIIVNGVRIHDLGPDPLNPICSSAADIFAPIVPSAHNLFVYDAHQNGHRYLVVATMHPMAEAGVHVLNIDNPASPVHVAFWSHPPDMDNAYCDHATATCTVHDVQVQRIGSQDLLFVAALADGVFVLDLTDVETAGFDLQNETVAHRGGFATRCATEVEVVDTTQPVIDRASVSPASLWPPNHQMVPLEVSIGGSDLCAETLNIRLVEAVSNEPRDVRRGGDGHAEVDIEGADLGMADFTVSLRAERQGGRAGRTYTLLHEVTDASGNATMVPVTVSVSHDQRP